MKFIGMLVPILLYGCTSEKTVVDFYYDHKVELLRIQQLAREIADGFHCEGIVIRGRKGNVSSLRMTIERPYKSMGYGFNNSDLSVKHFYPCDSCTALEREKYETLPTDSRLQELVRLYIGTKAVALKVNSEGVFFALGPPIRHKNKSEVEGGVFMPFGEEFNRAMIIQQIDGENANLYDTVVD
jgi:hypothetical protein